MIYTFKPTWYTLKPTWYTLKPTWYILKPICQIYTLKPAWYIYLACFRNSWMKYFNHEYRSEFVLWMYCDVLNEIAMLLHKLNSLLWWFDIVLIA